MATADVPSSSSSTPKSEKYDVFLSFHGKDTRTGFTSHLYAALCRKHIKTFKDNLDLEKGDEIKPELLEAIERSKFSVVVFSKNYASSSWCLAELAHIIKCHENYQKIVIPVFYDVEPTQVRNQKGSFEDAFVRHEQRLNDHTVLQEWREALRVAGNLSGFHLQAPDYRDESKLVEAIAEDIWGKLKNVPLSDDIDGFIGIGRRIQKIESLLSLDSPETRMVGIWGTGGLGKTTLAEVVFHKLSDQFKSLCFLANVREKSQNHGVTNLLSKLVSELLGDVNIKWGAEILPDAAQNGLRLTKVLVVLDDVDDTNQLDVLLGHNRKRFCDGSRIIITTRNENVLRHINVDGSYKVEELRDDEAIRLFESKALGGNSATPYSRELIDEVVKYAGGIPLVIRLLASQLRSLKPEGISLETILNVLKESCHEEWEKIFRMSYDGLNDSEKALFLDIASFFNGWNRDFVEDISVKDEFGWDSVASLYLNSLIDKSLITIKPSDKTIRMDFLRQRIGERIVSSDKMIWMHDLLQEFGQAIVRQQSEEQLGKRSRLWAEDAYRVLNNNEGTEKIEGIFLDLAEIGLDLSLKPDIFRNMCKLRLLIIHESHEKRIEDNFKHKFMLLMLAFRPKTYLNEGLRFLPSALRYIYWDGYPLKCLPSEFEPSNLVELHMPYSNLEKLWDGYQNFSKLKCINLSNSSNLKRLPNLSNARNLQRIYLQRCTSLVKVPWETLQSDNLIELDLRHSGNVSITLLERIFTLYWPSLEKLPVPLPRNLEALVLDHTETKEISSSLIEKCPGLQRIHLKGCRMIESLPSNIFKFQSLRVLRLEGCSSLKSLPKVSESTESLECLGLAHTGISELDLSIGNLIGIKELEVKDCGNLESIPESIYKLTGLERLELSNCQKLENLPPPIGFHNSGIEYLHLRGSNIFEIPPGIAGLKKLKHLVVRDCKNLRSIPELPVYLNLLDASGCTSLESVSNTMKRPRLCSWDMRSWETLDFSNFFECLKMNPRSRKNILNDFKFRVLDTPTNREPNLGIDPIKVKVWSPGNEIPKWFDNQFEGSSKTIPLPPQWHNANFLGFAFCLVIDAEALEEFHPFTDDYFNVECKFKFKIRDTEEVRSFDWLSFRVTRKSGGVLTLNSDHLLLWYQQQDYNDCLNAEEVSLEFSFKKCVPSYVVRFTNAVKRCGIHVLYSEDLKDISLIDSKYDDESDADEEPVPSDWEATDADEESEPNEDETTDVDEPHPKKMKHSY